LFRGSLEAIGQLQSYAGFDVLVRHVAGRDLQLARHADRGLQLNLWEVRALLRVYVDSLMIEWRPRKDILRSYGPIPCCSYTQIATGKYQFPLVSVLLECFGYRPDPRRQKFRGRRQPTGYVPSDQSLERNFRNFTATWPTFYERLRAELTEADYSDRPKDYLEYMLRPNDFVWRVALAPPTAQPLNG
jgi:hypothetical protein